MAAIWMRVRSELRTGRRSVFALALLIAIAGAAVLAPLAGARRTDSAYDRFLAEANTHDVETNEGVPGLGYDYELDLDAVARFPEVDETQTQRVFIVGIRTETEELALGSEAVVVRRELPDGGLNRVRIHAGRLPRPDSVNEVAIGYGLHVGSGVARSRPIALGEELTLRLLDPELITKGLDGIGTVAEVKVSVVGVLLVPGSVPPGVRYGQVFATAAFEERYRDSTANALGMFVKLKRGTRDLGSFQDRLVEMAEGGNVQFLTANDQDAGIRRSIDIYVVALQAFAGLAAAAALLIVTQTLVRQLTLGSDDHPALRSLGMSPGQLTVVALARTGVSAVAGVAAATLIAFGLSPLFPIGTSRVVEPSPGLSFDPLVLLAGSAALLLLIALPTVVSAFRASRRAQARERDAVPEGQAAPSRSAAALSRAGAPTPIVAGVRLALERGRGRSATPVGSTIIASAVAVASIVTLIAFGTSMRNLVDTPRLYGWNWDALAGNPYAPDLGAQLNPALAGIEQITEFSAGTTNIRVQLSRPGHPPEDTQALGLTPRKGEVFPPLLEGRWPVDDDEVALGTVSMRSLDVSVGDTIAVSLSGEPIRMTIIGRTVFPVVGDQYGGELGRGAGFTLEGIRRIVPNALENIFPVRFRPGIEVADLPREAGNLFFFDDETDVILGARPIDLVNLSKVTGAPLALTGLIALLGVATIAHALTTSVRRRRRDLAILKTLGFVKGEIWTTVATQASTLAIVALGIGIPLGLILGRTAWLSFAGGQGVVPEAILGLVPTLALVPVSLFLVNLVAAFPGRAAANLAPAIVLRTE